ncbi:MAG: cyclic nucleotide-binding domain-containing protein [SAR324 cluster bacterium]|nr:cyclic nucleotide-binding domain-containing protein [SAR324 cluster bacterium]
MKKKASTPEATNLPIEIRNALETISNFGNSLHNLDDGSSQALMRILARYGEILEKFNHINTGQQQNTGGQNLRVALLKNISLFQDLNSFDLVVISEKLEELHVDAGIDLLVQNQIAEGVFLIAEGDVEVLVNEELIAHRGHGACVGELSCLRGEAIAATVRTLTPSRVFRIEREEFLQTINKFPQLWTKLFAELTGRFNELNQRSSEILQHSLQGLIKITADGIITNEFSSQCVEYLDSNQLEGGYFPKIMFANDPYSLEGWDQIFSLIFDENIPMGFTEVVGLLPKETTFKHSSGKTRYYLLSYYPCYSPEKELVAIDIGIENITEEREAERKKEELETEKNILTKIYEDPESFMQTLQLGEDVLSKLAEWEYSLTRKIESSPEHLVNIEEDRDFPEMMRVLHTLKGMSGMFMLNTLQGIVHQLEDYLKTLQSNEKITAYQLSQISDQASKIKLEHQYAHSLLDNMSQELRIRLTGTVFSQEEFNLLKDTIHAGHITKIQELISKLEKVPIRRLVRSWPDEIKRLSTQLGKKIRFSIEGDNLLVHKSIVEKLSGPLVHIMRNCVDHGIESFEMRQAAGKPKFGRIAANMYRKGNSDFVFQVSDDGNGLDMEKIIEKARNNEMIDQYLVTSYIDKDEPWRLLFMQGFSTAETVTDVSGRGVGLDAVQTAISELNGTIQVSSELGSGTVFSFTIPFEI